MKILSKLLPLLLMATAFLLCCGPPAIALATPVSGIQELVNTPLDVASSQWSYKGTASQKDGYVQFTDDIPNQAGALWLNRTVAPPFTATFEFRISPQSNGRADGIVFMFNKESNTSLPLGMGLGYQTGNGYGLEFDTYYNSGFDPINPHIGLFKNSPTSGNLVEDSTSTAAASIVDGQWHSVKVDVGISSVLVYMDGRTTPTLNYSPGSPLNATYKGIGFSASTGGQTSLHQVRNVIITEPVPAFASVIATPASAPAQSVTVTTTVYDDDPASTVTKWIYGQLTDPATLDSTGTAYTGSFSVTNNGWYTLFAKNRYGKTAVQSIEVTNVDRIKPTLSVSPSMITIREGDGFSPPVPTVSDNFDSPGQIAVSVVNNVYSNAAGTYSVQYTATDRAGNVSAPATLTVHVTPYNSDLTDLNVLGHMIEPPVFNANQYDYHVVMGPTETELQLFYAAADASSAVTVTGAAYGWNEHTATVTMPLAETAKQVNIEVRASNTSFKTYHLFITRAASGNADLSTVMIDPTVGYMIPGLGSTTVVSNVYLKPGVTDLPITVQLSDSRAGLTVTGATYTASTVSGAVYGFTFPVSGLSQIQFKVTAQDGMTANTYTLNVLPSAGTNAVSFAHYDPRDSTLRIVMNRFAVLVDESELDLHGVTATAMEPQHLYRPDGTTEIVLHVSGTVPAADFTFDATPEALRDANGMPIPLWGVQVKHDGLLRQAIAGSLDADGFHLDDVMRFASAQTDLTGDDVIDRNDWLLLLSLIESKAPIMGE